MLSKTIKIAASCVLACSLSYLGKASDSIIEHDGSPSPSSSTTQPSVTDESLVQQTSEGTASSSFMPTDISASSKTAGKRKVSRSRSTSAGSKSNKVEKSEATLEASKKTPLSQGMQIEPASDMASMLASFGSYLMPKTKAATSKTSIAPQELRPIDILLGLLADDSKTHGMIYIPDQKMFIGYKQMLKGHRDQLKLALKFDEFKEMLNIKSAIKLLAIYTAEDLGKLKDSVDMEMAKDLISETQKEQWYQTRVRAKLDVHSERHEPNTLGQIQGQDKTESNLASYILYKDNQRLNPKSLEGSPTVSTKEKSKFKSKIKTEDAEEYLQVLLSVTKIKEQSRSLKREKSTTSRKRSVSKGASAPSSALDSPTSPRAQEAKAPEAPTSLPEVSTQPSLTPPSTGV